MDNIKAFYKGNYLNDFQHPKESIPKGFSICNIFCLWIFKQIVVEPCEDLLKNLTFEITCKGQFYIANLQNCLDLAKSKQNLKSWMECLQTNILPTSKYYTKVMALKTIFCLCQSSTQTNLEFLISGTWISLDSMLMVTLPKKCPKHKNQSTIMLVDKRSKCIFAITHTNVQLCLWNYNCYLFLQMLPNPYKRSTVPLENLCMKTILEKNLISKCSNLPYPIVQSLLKTKKHFEQIHLYNQNPSNFPFKIKFKKNKTLQELHESLFTPKQ